MSKHTFFITIAGPPYLCATGKKHFFDLVSPTNIHTVWLHVSYPVLFKMANNSLMAVQWSSVLHSRDFPQGLGFFFYIAN